MIGQSNEVSRADSHSLLSLLRLEEEYPEETQILEIEAEIGEIDRRSGKSEIDRLIRKRQQIIESWIQRIEKELAKARSHETREKLERELQRATEHQRRKLSSNEQSALSEKGWSARFCPL